MKEFLRRFFILAPPMLKGSVLLTLCWTGLQACHAADIQVEVSGVSATQAILRYRVPINRPCIVEVSESNTFRPLVHDVDPALFEGGSDSRSGALNRGNDHVFVIGQRKAQKARDGRWYSRALQANTDHYYRVDCGRAQATGSFRTANIALGNSYNEMFPPDPDATQYTPMGSYAWPEFVSWTDRTESVVDPQTGILLKRLTMPQDYPIDWLGDDAIGTVIDFDGKWNNPDAIKIDDSTAATFPGGGTDWLLLRDDSLTLGENGSASLLFVGRTIDSVQLNLKAWCSGNCAEEDRKIELCVTINGVSCAGAIREQPLGTTAMAADSAPLVVGTTTPILDYWRTAGAPPPDRTQFAMRLGTADVNGVQVSWKSGHYFNMQWMAGSRISLNGREFEIASVTGPKSLTLKANAGRSSSVAFRAANAGILVRKKTPSRDTISIQFARLKLGVSHLPEGWPSSGSPEICQAAVTLDSAGNEGFRCVINDAVPVVYWINRTTGDAKPVGPFSTDAHDGVDGWSNYFCAGFFSTTEANTIYCLTTDSGAGNQILLRCNLTGVNEPGGWKPVCTNLTPASKGGDIATQLSAFTGGKFDGSRFHCGVPGIQNDRILLACPAGGQDSLAWTAVFDPAKAQPDCSSTNSCIVAAQNTWSVAPARWCGLHTPFYMGAVDWYWIAGKNLQDAGGPGQGPYVSQITSGALGSTELSSCPASAPDPSAAGQQLCSTITVDGEPRDPSPYGNETGAMGELQDAAPGDAMRLEGELVELLVKSGNTWTVRRGFGGTSPVDHPADQFLVQQCLGRRFDRDTSNFSWSWDYLRDPTGANPGGATVKREYEFDHPAGRSGVVVGMASYLDCPWSAGCYAARTSGAWGAGPDVLVNGNQGFAGVVGGAPGNLAEDHASYSQVLAPDGERLWLLDGRPLQPGSEVSGSFTPAGGQLYKMSTTTANGDELNGAARLSRLKMPTFAFCGTQPLRDVSSAETGDVLGSTPSDSYKYCISRKGNECRTGAQPGDIWVNCPVVTTPSCSFLSEQDNVTAGICVTLPHMYLSSFGQAGFSTTDAKGSLGRKLTMGLSRNLLVDPYANARSLPDASWMLFRSIWLGGLRTEVLLAKLPPYPQADTIDRSDFVPMTLTIPTSSVPGTDNVVVQFGYVENGGVEDYFCTSRREACVKGADEGYGMSGDSIAGVPCADSCPVAIPAISGRVLYYRILYRDSQNRPITFSSPAVALVP